MQTTFGVSGSPSWVEGCGRLALFGSLAGALVGAIFAVLIGGMLALTPYEPRLLALFGAGFGAVTGGFFGALFGRVAADRLA